MTPPTVAISAGIRSYARAYARDGSPGKPRNPRNSAESTTPTWPLPTLITNACRLLQRPFGRRQACLVPQESL
jgi:hypothetical protein